MSDGSEQNLMPSDSSASEPEKTAARKRGRQAIDPALKKVQISVTLTPDLLQRLTLKAREHGISRSAFICLALDNACKNGLSPLSKDDFIKALKELSSN